MNKLLLFYFIPVFLFLLPYFFVNAQISRTLFIGSRGSDVKILQQILNNDPDTTVSFTGPGSKGNETEYFGFLTAKAVLAFQEKYSKDVLIPADLKFGTGIVGYFTRAKLNSITNTPIVFPTQQVTSASNNVAVEPSVSFIQPVPIVYKISSVSSKRGDIVTIYGENFSLGGNSVSFGGTDNVENISSRDQQNISFSVPNTLQNGTYDLIVKNNFNSKSNTPISFSVSDSPILPPDISEVIPKTVFVSRDYNPQVSVKGSGFSLGQNTIHSSLGSITNVKSISESELTFYLNDIPQFSQLKSNVSIKGALIPFVFGIVNNRGVTAKTFEILLQF